jgi:hypothetical protein
VPRAIAEPAVPFLKDSEHLKEWNHKSWRNYTALQQPNYPSQVREHAPCSHMPRHCLRMQVTPVDCHPLSGFAIGICSYLPQTPHLFMFLAWKDCQSVTAGPQLAHLRPYAHPVPNRCPPAPL